MESLNHGGYHFGKNIEIKWINSEDLDDNNSWDSLFSDVDGVLVPGGFGIRGINGKINAVKYVRENKIPYFGICLGMQCAVIEYSRNVLGLTGANSSEFDEKTPYPVIDLMPDQKNVNELGGTMRLGSYPCKVTGGTLAFDAYKEELVNERHRHRYELNNKYRKELENAGMAVSGIYMEKNLAEIIELKEHPWFVGCQFHPEFKSQARQAASAVQGIHISCHKLFKLKINKI